MRAINVVEPTRNTIHTQTLNWAKLTAHLLKITLTD